MLVSAIRFVPVVFLSFMLLLAGCKKPPYEVVAENAGGAFRIEQVQVIAKDRRWAEPGITLSGKVRGSFDPNAKPVVILKVSGANDEELLTSFDLEAIAEMYGADLKIGKNDERYSGAVEWNDQSNIELELGDSLPGKDSSQIATDLPPPAPQPVVLQQPPFHVGPMDFQFFIPWRALPAQSGTTSFHFSLLVLPDSVPPTEKPEGLFAQESYTQGPQNGFLKIKMPVVQPTISAYQVLVTEVRLDTTQFDPSDMDFTLAFGSNPRAGYPDIFWSVTVGQWLAWSSPRYKNSVSGHWETPSSPIYLYEDDQAGLCIFDFDDTTRDDEIGCWNGAIGDILATVDAQKTLSFPKVKYMKVFAEKVTEGAAVAAR